MIASRMSLFVPISPLPRVQVYRAASPSFLSARCMAKGGKKNAKRSKRARSTVAPSNGPSSSPALESPEVVKNTSGAAADPTAAEEAQDMEMLRQDVAAFKARRKKLEEEAEGVNVISGTYDMAKKVFDNVLLFDFFLVLGLLGWLIIALVPHFVAKNDMLLDPWLALWQPVIQPILGVLMLATIGQGMLTYMFSKGD